jgi:hypothetical protein
MVRQRTVVGHVTRLIFCVGDEATVPERGWRDAHAVVYLGWLSPESRAALEQRVSCDVFDLHDVLADDGEAVTKSSFEDYLALVRRGAEYLGANLFAPCSMVADELIQPRIAYQLLRWAEGSSADVELVFPAPHHLAELADLCATTHGGPRVTRAPIHPGAPRRKFLQPLAEARMTRGYGALGWRTFERLDRTHRYRGLLSRRNRLPVVQSLFFSSYVSYSRAIVRFALESPPPLWVFNSHQARHASGDPTPARFLWDLSPSPSRVERSLQAEAVAEAGSQMLGMADDADGFPLAAMMRLLPALNSLREDIVAHLASEAFLIDHALQATAPSEVWVGNQWGSEGLVVQLARKHGIPVTQVQHGVLDRNFRWSEINSDRFVVWDELWKAVLPERERAKTEVKPWPPPVAGSRRGDSITFFTQPRTSLVDNRSARQEVVLLLRDVVALGHPVRVRVHQSDSARDWVGAWDTTGLGRDRILFEKETPLEQTLSRTSVALLLSSTVFLECAARGIPVVALGWFPIPHRRELIDAGILTVAMSRSKAMEQVVTAISGAH